MRTVSIHKSEEFDNAVNDAPADEVAKAIGYLATWAMHNERYASATIFGDSHGDLHATYRNAGGDVTYTMFGMRAPASGSYSFHS